MFKRIFRLQWGDDDDDDDSNNIIPYYIRFNLIARIDTLNC